MPKEYIEREALLTDISESVVFSGRTGHVCAETRGARKIVDRIKVAPVVDVIEVVRCKECIHLGIDTCGTFCTATSIMTGLEHFCSHGERKDGLK